MSDRVIGMMLRDTNYEVTIRKPLDARSLVKSYSALLNEDNWLNEAGKSIAYNGMLVAVADTDNTTYNGLYFLFDPNCKSILKSPDVTKENNWVKIGETTDISGLVTRLSTIETELDSIERRLTTLETAESDVQTYGYRSGFPAEGKPNILYVAVDEERSYVWVNDKYLAVGSDSGGQPEVIFGGTAD